MRVAVEDDAEHVPYLALVPVRRRPDIGNGGHQQIVGSERDLETDVRVTLERQQVIDDSEIAWRLIVAVRAGALVDGGEVIQHAVRLLRFQFQVAQDIAHAVPRDPLRGHAIAGFLRRPRLPRQSDPSIPAQNIGNVLFQDNAG